MSNPQNILGKFDTYAYHHILMVCDSTETAEALAKTDEITTFQHPRNAKKYTARTIGEVQEGKYVTLIDGTTDVTFFITEARWSNVIAAESHIGKGDIPQSTTMSTDGEMEIVEPLGASFLNRLTEVCDDLETDPVGLIFLLKTIFVGHNSDGTSDMISTVRPMMFVTYDISAIFDNSGGKYKLEFVGLTNGMGKLPQPNSIFNGLSFKMGETLGKTFFALQEAVNKKYDDFKLKVVADFAETLDDTNSQATSDAEKFLIENYRKVQYRIISEDYSDSNYKAGDVESVRIADSIDGDSILNYGPKVGIESILNRIMASSKAVMDDTKDPEKKFIYKIISTLRSTPNEYIMEYHINKYEQAISPYTQQEKDGKIEPLPGQSIEFDYIFTGKNVDIKSFDIKMEMGMAFFQMAATTNNIPSTVAGNGMKLRGKTPLFLGSSISTPMARNTKRPIDSAGFQALLERHAALENISASMVIYGNPQLLDEMSILPSEVASKQTEPPAKDATINPRWLSTPTLIKVNIKMPVDANDTNTEYETFWYSGYYSLMEVENIFNGGEFTQQLHMFSIPIGNETESSTDKELSAEEKKELAEKAKSDKEAADKEKADAASPADKQRVLTRRGFRFIKRAPIKHEFVAEE